MCTLLQGQNNQDMPSAVTYLSLYIFVSSLLWPNQKNHFSEQLGELLSSSCPAPSAALSPPRHTVHNVREMEWPSTASPQWQNRVQGRTLFFLVLGSCSDAPHTLFSDPSDFPSTLKEPHVGGDLRPACSWACGGGLLGHLPSWPFISQQTL